MNLQFNIQNSKLKIAKAAVFLASLTPLYCLAYFAFTDNLGANPIEVITHWTGDSTIIFLLITLTVTPLRKISGWNDAVKFRRMLGLFAFFYACLHFTTYIWLDQFFDFRGMIKDIAKRPFITVGFTSFVLLIPLAVTSTAAMVRRLGKRWQKLHRAIYVIAAAGVIHYWWLVKKDIRWPLIYGGFLTALLGYRFVSGGAFAKAVNRVRLSGSPLQEKAQGQ
jgi:sulfoxide reductase heme-binding subunit YedZ